MNLTRFDITAKWHSDNGREPLTGSDLNQLIDAIESLDSQVDWLKDRLDDRLDYVQEQLSDHIRGGD